MAITEILNKILDVCCKEFEVTKNEALSKSRKKELVFLRKIFVIVAKKKYKIPNEKLCKFFNQTNSNIENLYKKPETDGYFECMLENVIKSLQ